MQLPSGCELISTLPSLSPRPVDGHKGTFGRVLITGGSRGMAGAIGLAGIAALRGGTGLVTLACPESISQCVSSYEPSYLTLPLPDDQDGKLSLLAAPQLLAAYAQQTAGAIGPGLGRSHDLDELVVMIYRSVEQPLVVDADALNALAARNSLAPALQRGGPRVLTPHPGELSRLMHCSISALQAERVRLAVEYAASHQVVLVLKGAGTVVTDGQRVAINTTGNSGMATGGTGDVLTGLVTALLAQQLEPFSAAQLAVYLHGLAGDLAAEGLTQPALIASDLLRYLPRAWAQVLATPAVA